MRHQEFQHTRAALTFLCLFMSGTQDAGPHREAAAHCMHARGADLMRQCLVGLSGTSPPNQVRVRVRVRVRVTLTLTLTLTLTSCAT